MKDWEKIVSEARRLEEPCACCSRRCGAMRHSGEVGWCGAAGKGMVSKFFITYGEEPCLTPAYMLYFTHCNMRCAYCTNMEYIQPGYAGGSPCGTVDIARIVDEAWGKKQIRAFQVLGGEPGCSLSAAMETAACIKSSVPIVWNSNFCFSDEAFEVLAGAVDFWVADLKFGCGKCAHELAAFDGYWETVTENLRRVPADRLLVRHLPLGGHWECCSRPVIDFLKTTLPGVPVACHPLIPDKAGRTRSLSPVEQARLDEYIAKSGLKRIFAQACMEGSAETRQEFPGEIVIRKDGSIMVQDFSAPMCGLIEKLQAGQWK